MGEYTNNAKMLAAKEAVEKLGSKGRDKLVRYYIEMKEKELSECWAKLKEYQNFFEELDRLLPTRNRRFAI